MKKADTVRDNAGLSPAWTSSNGVSNLWIDSDAVNKKRDLLLKRISHVQPPLPIELEHRLRTRTRHFLLVPQCTGARHYEDTFHRGVRHHGTAVLIDCKISELTLRH